MKDNYNKNDKKLSWKILESSSLYNARIFQLRSVLKQDAGGRKASFVSLDSPDWVTVIPETGEKDFLIVRQYRHGTENVSMEFPAGLIDPGETPQQAAARELLEETGYTADSLIQIGCVSPNPAFMTNYTYTFLAKGLSRVSEQNLDEHEILDVYKMPYKDVSESIGTGTFASAITVQAWYFYRKYSGDC